MKNFKRIFSLMLAVCVMATAFAGLTITTSAAAGTPATEVYYGGAKLDATNKYLLVPATSSKDPVPVANTESAATIENVSYVTFAEFDAVNGTLTIKKGYTLLQNNAVEAELLWNSNVVMKPVGTDTTTLYGIKANGDLTIDLGTYHNSLFIGWNDDIKNVNIRGIDVDGNLTIKGTTGSMRITGSAPCDTTPGDNDAPYTNYGINTTGDVKLLGGTVYIYDRPFNTVQNGDSATFINAGGNIYVDGAKVKFRARKTSNNASGVKYVSHTNKDMIVASCYTTSYDTNLEIEHSNKAYGFTIDNGADYGNQNNLTLTPPAGAYKITIGKDSVELGGINKYLYASAADSFTVGSTADGAIAEYDAATETLKFLSDATLKYWDLDGYLNAWIIVSDSDLTIDLNGKNVSLQSMPHYTTGGAVNVSGDLTIKGGGNLDAYMRCVYIVTDKKGAVLKSGSKIKFEDVTANVYTTGDCGLGDVNRSGYVMDAPAVEFTESSTVRCATGTWQATGTNTPGRIFKESATVVTIPKTADAFVGNMNTVTTGNIPAEDSTVKTYSSDLLASSTYFAVSTMDTTVSVDSVAVAVADGTATFKLSGGVPVLVIAAGYDANGILSNAVTYSGTADGEEHTLSVGTAETVKLYIWNTLDELKPLKKVRIY